MIFETLLKGLGMLFKPHKGETVVSVKKTGLLFIAPLVHRPDLPNFRDRVASLAETHDVHVIAPCEQHFDGLRMGGAQLHTIPPYIDKQGTGAFSILIQTVCTARRITTRQKIDVIVAYDPLTLGLAATILKPLIGAKTIIEINGHLLTAAFLNNRSLKDRFKKALYKAVIGFCLRRADAIKLLNHRQEAEFDRYLLGKPVFIFPDYVPTHVFTKSSDDHGFIFFAGYPFFLKGIDILITAFKKIAERYPTTRLIIMGYHSPEEAECYARQIAGCSQIEIKRPVDFDKIRNYFLTCSFLVLPSRTEAMGRVLIEAMACGKPVVASNVGGIPEIVRNNENGFLFQAEDPDDLAKKMSLFLDNPELLKTMGDRAYNDAVSRLSSDRYISRFNDMIAAVMK